MIKKNKPISEYEKTIFCRKWFVGWLRVHANDSNEWRLASKFKYIKMSREEGGFQALLTQLPLVIVCHELIIWRLTIYGFAMVWNVGAVCHVKPSR